jgi:peptidoglycan/xylan/chitin deacetylase (PgdA/CDA1 family)
MSKRKQPRFNRLHQVLVSVFVFAIFALPAYTTGNWIFGAITNNDPRKTIELPEFKPRPADTRAHKELQPLKEPVLTISFDDGWESAYSSGLPLMQQYGVVATQYILGGEFQNIAYMSEEQIKDLQKHNHEVASHTMTHPDLTSLNDEDLYREVVESRNTLTQKFGPINDFASPLGAQNERTIDIIKKNYRSQRNTEADPKSVGPEDVNMAQTFNRYNIIAYTVRDSTTHEELRNLINFAIENNAWVVLTYHQIDYSGSYYAITPELFERQLQLIWSMDIRTATMGQFLDKATE